jgi:hypothetical protein
MPALDKFVAHKQAIDALLAEIAALSAGHFATLPDDVHWGHVGTLSYARQKIAEAAETLRALARSI